MIKVGIIGGTGYIGQELVRLLNRHDKAEIKYITSRSYINKSFDNVYENYRDILKLECTEQNIEAISEEVDVIFIALPHGVASKEINTKITDNTKVIDLGADFRLSSRKVYEKWYKTEHLNEQQIKNAVYGLCEWKRKEIKEAQLIANPGCYTTCSILSLAPLLKDGIVDEESIIIDAKSGVTGAGRTLNIGTHYTECNESVKAYTIAEHRHTPEIEEQLSEMCGNDITINFTPHLIPMNRGILTTCYAKLKNKITYDEVKSIYEKYYQQEHFIRLTKKGVYPETKWVKGSNYCDIGFKIDERTGRIIIVGAIDNMIKGSAGQAVQNMNIIFGLEETTGLKDISIFPI